LFRNQGSVVSNQKGDASGFMILITDY